MANASMVNIGSVSGYVDDINRQARSEIRSTITTEINTNKQPAYINLILGNSEYRTFVNDITNTQNKQARLHNRFKGAY